MSDTNELEVPPSPDPETKPPREGKKPVRKRSVRRCISTGKEEAIPLGYGRNIKEYDKIAERVLADKNVQSAVETLQERWRMMMIMYEDCMFMVEDWDERQRKKADKIDYFQLLIVIMVSISVLIPVVCIVYRFG